MKSNAKTLSHALTWLADSYPLDYMDFMESGIFEFLMKNLIDSAKKSEDLQNSQSEAEWLAVMCVTIGPFDIDLHCLG